MPDVLILESTHRLSHKFDLTPLIDPSQLSYTQKCFENRMTIRGGLKYPKPDYLTRD